MADTVKKLRAKLKAALAIQKKHKEEGKPLSPSRAKGIKNLRERIAKLEKGDLPKSVKDTLRSYQSKLIENRQPELDAISPGPDPKPKAKPKTPPKPKPRPAAKTPPKTPPKPKTKPKTKDDFDPDTVFLDKETYGKSKQNYNTKRTPGPTPTTPERAKGGMVAKKKPVVAKKYGGMAVKKKAGGTVKKMCGGMAHRSKKGKK